MLSVLPEQRVIVYDGEDEDGSPEEVVYTTVYNADQVNYYIARCIVRHGGASKPRVRYA